MDLQNKLDEMLAIHVRPYAWGLALVTVLTLMALGPIAHSIAVAGDDWITILEPLHQADWVVQIGRWGVRLQWELLPFRSFNPSFIVLGNALLIAVAGLAAARLMGFDSPWGVAIFAGFFALAPVWSESYHFTLGQYNKALTVVLAVTMAWATLRFCDADIRTPKAWAWAAAAVGAFVLVASLYQVRVVVGMEVFCMAVLLRMVLQPDAVPTRAIWQRYLPRSLGVLLVGMVAYFLSIVLFRWIYDVPPLTRADYSPFGLAANFASDPFGRVVYFGRVLWRFYFGDMHMVPAIFGWTIVAGVVVCLADHWRCSRDPELRPRIRRLSALAIVVLLLVLPFLFGLVRHLRLNMVTSSAVLFAFFIAYPLQRLTPGLLRSFFALLAYSLLFLGGYQLSVAGTTKQLNFDFDMRMAASLVEQLRHRPRISELHQGKRLVVSFVGRHEYGPATPYVVGQTRPPLRTSITNCGVFNCQLDRFRQAVKILGYNRDVSVRILTPAEGRRWITKNLTLEEREALPDRALRSWQNRPDEGLLVGRNGEVLILLESLMPPRKITDGQ